MTSCTLAFQLLQVILNSFDGDDNTRNTKYNSEFVVYEIPCEKFQDIFNFLNTFLKCVFIGYLTAEFVNACKPNSWYKIKDL
jgi:hypothetical protein